MPWLAITVEVEPALAEALSEALIEAGADSVDLELSPARTRLTALAARGADASRLVAAAAQAAGMPAPDFSTGRVEDDDWVRRSQSQFTPQRVGRRLWIVPSWHEPPAPPALTVRLDPGLAFGTGSHPSTRLILSFLEREIRGNERVLDYGCGSGILAIAAAKLGAGAIDAVDIDPQAVGVANENARLNAVPLRAMLPEALPAGTYDLVLANILSEPLIGLAPELSARTRPGGRILLSGLFESQAEDVQAAYAPCFDTGVADHEGDWVLIEGRRR